MFPTNYEVPEAKFNAAILSITRLHNALVDCNNYAYSAGVSTDPMEKAQYITQWKFSLDVFYREVSSKLKGKIDEDEKLEIENERKVIAKLPKLLICLPTESGKIEHIIYDSTYKLYEKIFHALEIKLRFYADKYKLLIPNKDNESRFAASH